MLWQLKWSQAAANYVSGNAPYTLELFNAVVALASIDDGLPTHGAHNLGDGYVMGDIADHTVVWELRTEGKLFIVWAIKPKLTNW